MKPEALNCPNCGAAVVNDSVQCSHCKSRLKTMSCGSCYETFFEGSNFCPLCGSPAVSAGTRAAEEIGDCPRCRRELSLIEVEGVTLHECARCSGTWCDVDTFESVCSRKEGQAAVIARLEEKAGSEEPAEIRYVPCPVCGTLMNRSNFARISGIVIDSCKPHGVWFDARELSGIIRFIQKGGLDLAREKEKRQISEERDRLKQEKFSAAVERFRESDKRSFGRSGSVSAIREFIEYLLD